MIFILVNIISQIIMSQSVEAADTLSNVLQRNGGWGLSAVLMCVIWFLARDNLKQRDSKIRQLQEQYVALFDMMGKRIEADVKHEQALKQLTRLIEKLLAKI